MSYTYPFTYDVIGDRRGFLPLGMKLREHYLRWVATEELKHVNSAVPLICQFVGWHWKRIFGSKPMDRDVLDPVAYKVIFRYVAKTIPVEHSFAHWLRVLVRRSLIRNAYKTYVPEEGDKSIRDFSYRPFMSPADIEHNIFIGEMKALLMDHISDNIRFEEDKRKACRYLAEVMMEEKMPSPLVLKTKFGIPYSEQQFYVDFITVTLRKELYKLRASLPHLFTIERTPFIAVVGNEDELEETSWRTEENSAFCDL